ncbi:caspase family protein [Paenibacillus koleovorans]|uniref:caspase family protein n=1 Tax=Paenibacillus koleovorans TaxID=121608 RepID=UPI000FDC4E20|nr:caspase family protein [Paenibacillus koleovorans]
MTKRAVVVGVNDYSVQGFTNLRGCVRDAQAMYHLLVDAFLFDPSQVWLYTDNRATSSNIRQAIRYMLSISEPGDVACLYYAGHGGLHPVAGGGGASYQTIIPYSGTFITDWDLAMAAEALEPSRVNFTIILDSCHSGGMHEETEHPGAIRSIRYATEFIQSLIATLKKVIPFGVTVPGPQAYSNNVTQVAQAGNGLLSMSEDPNQLFVQLAKSTLFAACRWNEYAGETPDHGYFTQAFLDLVNQSNFTVTHRAFHQQLVDKVHQLAGPNQSPQLRGQQNRMDEDFLLGWRDCR